MELRHLATLTGALAFFVGGVAIAESGFNEQNISIIAFGAAMLGISYVAESARAR